MWWDRSISAAVVRQLSCSSRQLVNSAWIGKGNDPERPLRMSSTGPPALLISSSRLGMARLSPCSWLPLGRLLLLSDLGPERADPLRCGREAAERVEMQLQLAV